MFQYYQNDTLCSLKIGIFSFFILYCFLRFDGLLLFQNGKLKGYQTLTLHFLAQDKALCTSAS